MVSFLSVLFSNVFSMFTLLPSNYRWKISILFFLQILNAGLEVVSLAAIIPFLNALANYESLVANQHVSYILASLEVQDKTQVVVLFSAAFAVAFCCSNLFKTILLWFQRKLLALIYTDMGTLLYRKILYKPYSFFLDNNSSKLVGNLTHDLNSSFGALLSIFTLVTYGLSTIFIVVGLLFYASWSSLVLLGGCSLSYGVIVFWVRRKLDMNGMVESQSYQSIIKNLHESFHGIRYVILNDDYNFFTEDYRKKYFLNRMANAKTRFLQQVPRFFIESVGVVVICCLSIWFSINSSGRDFLPFMGLLAMGSLRLAASMHQCYNSISGIMITNFSLQKVVNFLCSSEGDEHIWKSSNPIFLYRGLSLKDVSFVYEKKSKEKILCNLSLTINAKSTVAIVGATGSGKSTLADIILGLIVPDSGEMVVDGQTISDSNIADWQSSVAHVPQSIFMADASVVENIAMGIPTKEIDQARIRYVAKQAQIHNFLETLPNKYDTRVGERGVKLSGGQIQRIGIARALYRSPQLIIFDEATSALDTATEKAVMESIYNISGKRTFIIIAHRISTVKNAEVIFVLEKGRLVAQGTYNELLKKSKIFQQFTA